MQVKSFQCTATRLRGHSEGGACSLEAFQGPQCTEMCPRACSEAYVRSLISFYSPKVTWLASYFTMNATARLAAEHCDCSLMCNLPVHVAIACCRRAFCLTFPGLVDAQPSVVRLHCSLPSDMPMNICHTLASFFTINDTPRLADDRCHCKFTPNFPI